MPRHLHRPIPALERTNLFRLQVQRFRFAECRKPKLSELRTMWRGTGFRVAI